ncbi:probable long-chain-alcohol O-fatty-acyltransferase 5 [Amaranthus tricolor]|uniref:probable long-chain-alcohol O-fatty-acyltransferase 5 n=1 Tax=Amaranthus tricolor TaxID=29722 RepID=UPI00258ED66B|nr:probable long-chain-alcohol O-fatty-acyltransferase 5 [Amaranthus tricolor]
MEEEEGLIIAFIKVWLKVLISLIYAYFIVSKLPKGKFRVFSLLPIFSLFTILPYSLSTPTTAGLTGFFITWLANFKLVLFCFDLGPLSQDLIKNSLFYFILISSFPIKIKQNGNYPITHTQKNNPKLPLNLWSKLLIYILLVFGAFLCNYNQVLNQNILLGIYCCVVYLNLEIVMGFCNKLVGSILGMELCPPFDEPYLSTSLQDFWGRRWNLMVSDVLRHTIYFPTRAYWEIHIGKKWAQIVATLGAFIVSGLMHELLFFYITRASPTWEVTCFFLLHGVSLVVEIGLKTELGFGGLHWALAGPLTIGFVMATGFWLFFPQLVRTKVDVRSLEEIKAVSSFIKGVLGIN